VVVRLALPDGNEAVATRRSSDADDAAERREKFLQAVETGQFTAVELDVAGYYVSEGSVPCSFCVEGPPHEEWQHVLLRELLRIGAPAAVPAGLSPEDADDAEQAALDRQVAALLRSR
jgi:hypothetical protein